MLGFAQMTTDNWTVEAVEDGDGHLCIYAKPTDDGVPFEVPPAYMCEDEYHVRLSAPAIEERYHATLRAELSAKGARP